MKKVLICLLSLLVLLQAAACGLKKTDTSGYQIYFTNNTRTKLVGASYSPQSADTMAVLGEIFAKMHQPSAAEQQLSLFPQGVEITDYTLVDGQLTLTFNKTYLQMDNVTEILLRSGIVKTVTQIADVRTVVFHIGEDVLKDASGEPVGAMTSSQFINNPVGINSYQYASLVLYFSNGTGDKLVREIRNVHYSSNTTLEKVVMEQLMKGPMNTQLQSVFPHGVKVLGISISEKTCTVNLSQEFTSKETDGKISPEVVIYSIVNSLCDMLGVDKVQFQVDGESEILFGETLNLNGPFHRNSEMIEAGAAMEEKENTMADPFIGL